MMIVVNYLNNLGLDHLDHGWVKAIYHSEFLEVGDLPPEYESSVESLDLRLTFNEIINSIDVWLNPETESNEEKSWATLSRIVPHQKVLALLAFYIDHGCKNVRTKEYRNNAIMASRVYFKLLSVPGYKAYNVYHSQLFTHSLACLSFPKAMCDDECHFNTRELTREVNSVIKELKNFVLDLRAIIEQLQLSPLDINFEDILSNLVDITGGAIVNKLHVDKIELTNMSGVIYEIIDIIICDVNREPNAASINLLFKCLLPKLIASCLDSRNANNLVRASYVTYSGLVLSKYGKAALSGYTILLEHLCYSLDGLERAEIRSARVSLVVGLMSLLPHKSYRKFVQWLLRLSSDSKLSHRQIAIEMLANLLSNEPEPTVVVPAQNDEVEVNGATVAEGEPQPSTSQASNNQLLVSDHQNSTDKFIINDDDSSQDSVPPVAELDADMAEEDVAGLLRQRAHTVSHKEILFALYERAHDESATLRTRAITIITDCLSSTRTPVINAIKELKGDGEVSRLTALGTSCVANERAVVRKAGAILLVRLLADKNAPPPQATDLSILVLLCRDATMLVRLSVISLLGELTMMKPTATVFDAFLAGPMHQLTDPESKVQDLVGNLIKQMLIDRLRMFEPSHSEDTLPWMFLAGITRRKMKNHLQKACLMLSKSSNCINHRLVDIVSTHLGVVNDERDLQCLVLLTSLARYVDYNDVAFVLEYYYKLTDRQVRPDARLLPLTLELLTLWSRFITSRERSTLRDHVVERLATSCADGNIIPSAMLASHLDPDNLTWATELMQLSERRALEANEIEEGIRAVDLSIVAPVPPSPALLSMFVNAIKDPPLDWDACRLGTCVAGAARLSVRSRDVAAVAAPALAALLSRARAPLSARINALLGLSDISVRHTCIVEPLLGTVCGCLSPNTPAPLRRAASRQLTRLLLGGYLRLRTPLYYRYCALLADEDLDVREPVEFYIVFSLTTDAIYHHFVDCVLYYNHEKSEPMSFDSRQLIYDVMLQRMSLIQKLNTQCRLAREVLEHAADLMDEGEEELSPAMNAALLDTITLLCGPRMKLPRKPHSSGDGNEIDDLQERVTTNIVSHKMKCTVVEVLMPAVSRLFTWLKPRGGQIATYLVHIARDLMNDYQSEIKELVEHNEELMKYVQLFQETIALETPSGNVRNLVTATAPPEPETPRASRRRPRNTYSNTSPRKRMLRI